MKSRSLLKLKKLILILILGLISNQLLAQNNIGIFFQAVARDNYSNPAKSRKIYIQSSVIQSSATGTKVLIEEHQANTDATGMFNISIGNGTRVGGSATGFSSIDWSNGPFFLNLKVAITPMSGVNGWDYTKEWVDMGTTSFGAVPYALYAANAAGVNQKLNISDTTKMLSVYAKSISVQALEATVNTKLSLADSLTKYVTPRMLAANAFDSTSLSNRINLKASTSDVNTSLATKVDKVTGKELSTNDYTTAEKTKLAAITGTNTGDQDLSALATNTALALKANTADVTSSLATKVDKVTGKELSTNDYTTAEKTKLAAITGTNTGDQDLSALATNTALALKANASDVNNSLALKANTADVTNSLVTKVDKVTGKELSTNDYTTAEKTKLAAITGTNTGDQDLSALATNTALALKANTADVNTALALKANAADVTNSLATKVDKVTGKELSTNDYTTAEKTKLAAITGTNTGDQDLSALATNTALALKANTADVNNSLALKANVSSLSSVATSGSYNDLSNKPTIPSAYTLPTASASVLGGVKVGSNLSIDASGVLSANVNAGSISGTVTVANGGTGATTLTGLVKGNGTNALTEAIAGTDYQAPLTLTTTGTGAATFSGTTLTIPTYSLPIADGTNLGGVKVGSNLNVDANGVLTANINAGTLTGTTLAANVVNSSLTSVGTITSGTISLTTDIATTGNLKAGNNTYPNSNGNDGQFLKTNGSGTLSWADVPSPNLGNYVTTNTGQTIEETKTFSKDITVNGITVGQGKDVVVNDDNGPKNTAIGRGTLSKNTGIQNTAIGFLSLGENTTGAGNTAIGSNSLFKNVSGADNTAIGLEALRLNVGSQNTAVGRSALSGSILGSSKNTAIGYFALRSMANSSTGSLTGTGNTAVGSNSGEVITSGSNNITIGGGDGVGTGSSNTLVGVSAKVTSASTSNATAIGFQSKSAVQGTAIGNSAFALASKATALGNSAIVGSNASNSTAIGNGATIDASNATALGNAAIVGLNASNSTAIGYGAKVSDPNTIQLGADGTTDIDGVTIPAVTDVKTRGAITAVGYTAFALDVFGNVNPAITATFNVAGLTTPGTLTAGAVTYPNTHGTSGQVLSTTGSGTLSWTSIPAPDQTNYVTTNTVQTITASKTFSETTTFSKDAIVNGITVGRGGGNKAYNTAIGAGALFSNTGGNNNTVIGASALFSNTEGGGNIAIGGDALALNTSGLSNTAIGVGALSNNVTGEFNTAIGYLANVASGGLTNTTAIGNGASVSASNTIQLGNADVTDVKTSGNLTVNGITVGKGGGNQDYNTVIGEGALPLNTTGKYNTANGAYALSYNTTGQRNTAVGIAALEYNTEGFQNTAIGHYAGVALGSGTIFNTTAIGNEAVVSASNTIQLGNNFVTNVKTSGTLTAGTVTYPNAHNSTSGQVLTINSTGTATWAAAAGGVPYTGATGAVNLGAYDLTVNGITVGIGGGNVVSRNTAIGSGALQNNSSNANGADGGLNNTAIGSGALSTNTVGDENTASGYRALRFNINGRFNTASGSSALINNTSGDYNTAFGLSALQTNTTGSNNTAIGNAADVKFDNLTNATAIGNGAIVAASHTIQLGNAAVTDVKTSGAITASNYITSSDLRLKSNISPLANSLATVMQLNPVHYMKKSSLASTAYTREENGFIAQEIQKILPFIVKEGTDENKLLSVDYNSFIPMLTKAIQEQQKQIEEQNSKIAAQQKQIEELIKLMKELKK